MKRDILIIATIVISMLISSCNRTGSDTEHVKKVELKRETIAVGIYIATGFDYPNVKYIAEALKIDGGVVYVTLTDADVLKTRLENIDVIIFPGMRHDQKIDKIDDEIAEIIKNFILQKGKGAICLGNGGRILSKSENYQSLDLINIDLIENTIADFNLGIIKFQLSDEGKRLFPELEDFENLSIDFNHGPEISIIDTTSDINVLGEIIQMEANFPLFITAKTGKGKIAITNASPETTPGMRWMVPRLVRWSVNKDFVWYDKNVFRPELFKDQVILDDEMNSKIKMLLTKLEKGKKDEIFSAMDELQKIYPWIAAEKVRLLLIEKNYEIKLEAAKYLVDIEYTLAIEDLEKLIKDERRKKMKEQLIAYKNELELMLEQN
ncbi:hypothetical protein ACFLSE_06375 [Bacteroidota bacterium]